MSLTIPTRVDVSLRYAVKPRILRFNMLKPDIVKAGPESFDVNDADEPHVIRFNNKYLMYYAGQGDDGYWAICLAESTDLKTWVKKGRVIGGPPNLKPMAITVKDNTIYLYAMYWGPSPAIYTGRLYTSTDGVNFTDEGTVISPDDFDVGSDGATLPVAVWFDEDLGKWFMIYRAWRKIYDPYGVGRNLFLAESDDGKSWSKKGILVRDAVHGLDTGEGDIVKIADKYFYICEYFTLVFKKPHGSFYFSYSPLRVIQRLLTDPETYGFFGSGFDDYFPILTNGKLYMFTGEAKSPSNIHLFECEELLSDVDEVPVWELARLAWTTEPHSNISIDADETKRFVTKPVLHCKSVTVNVSDDQGATVNIYADFDGRGNWKKIDYAEFTSAFSKTWVIDVRAVYIIVEVVQGSTAGTLDVYFVKQW